MSYNKLASADDPSKKLTPVPLDIYIPLREEQKSVLDQELKQTEEFGYADLVLKNNVKVPQDETQKLLASTAKQSEEFVKRANSSFSLSPMK